LIQGPYKKFGLENYWKYSHVIPIIFPISSIGKGLEAVTFPRSFPMPFPYLSQNFPRLFIYFSGIIQISFKGFSNVFLRLGSCQKDQNMHGNQYLFIRNIIIYINLTPSFFVGPCCSISNGHVSGPDSSLDH
jgi:hypothetical protein